MHKWTRLLFCVLLIVVFWLFFATVFTVSIAGSTLLDKAVYDALVENEEFQSFTAAQWSASSPALTAPAEAFMADEQCRIVWSSAITDLIRAMAEGDGAAGVASVSVLREYFAAKCAALSSPVSGDAIDAMFRYAGATPFTVLLPGLQGTVLQKVQGAMASVLRVYRYRSAGYFFLIFILLLILALSPARESALYYWSLPGVFLFEAFFITGALLSSSLVMLAQNIVSYLGAGTAGLRLYVSYAVEHALGTLRLWSVIFGLLCLAVALYGVFRRQRG